MGWSASSQIFQTDAASWGADSLVTDGEYLYFTWGQELGDIWVMDVEWDEE